MPLKKIKEYENREEYKEHQISKTSQPKLRKRLKGKAEKREAIFKHNFEFAAQYGCIKEGQRALCMGARLGEEVRVLKDMGVDALGIDLVPYGEDVIEMDFTDLEFQGETFDIVYSNSLDHTDDMDTFLEEAFRVLKHKGFIIFDIMSGEGNIGATEVYELDVLEIIKIMVEELDMELFSVNVNLKKLYKGGHKSAQVIFRKGTKR